MFKAFFTAEHFSMRIHDYRNRLWNRYNRQHGGDYLRCSIIHQVYTIAPFPSITFQVVYVTDGWLPRWSPDGSQIVYAKNRDIWTTTVDGRKQVNLTKNPLVEDRYPAWQPSRTPHRLKTKLLTRWATFKMKETEQRAQTRTPIQ